MVYKGCVTDILEDKTALVWSPTFRPFCEPRDLRVRHTKKLIAIPWNPHIVYERREPAPTVATR